MKALRRCSTAEAHGVSRRSFLKTAAALAGGGPLFAPSLKAKAVEKRGPLMAYVGAYSSPLPTARPGEELPPGSRRGIHLFQVDRATGALAPCGVLDHASSPSCLALSPSGTHVYSSDETARMEGSGSGSVSAFAINELDGQLTLLNTISSGGGGPTYLSVHPSGRFVFVANYGSGSVAVLPILPDGRLGPASDVQQDVRTVEPKPATKPPEGSSAAGGRDVPRAHMIAPDPSGRFVISTDTGLDEIRVWKFDDHAGILTPNDPPAISIPAGDGPRHFAFHPDGHWFYSLQEKGANIVLCDYDSTTGRLAPRQTVSSLPPGFVGSCASSGILVSADGRFVYAANREHDGIAILSVGETGALTFATEESPRGGMPRSFNFDPSGSFLYSCNQTGNNVAVFRIDRKSGGLAFTGQLTPVANASNIVFRDLGKAG